MEHPAIIQGGMGAGISDWRLARAVSRTGQLGVVSGTALDTILARRLQTGDPGGHMRRALERFPVPAVAQRVLDKYYITGGKEAAEAFRSVPVHTHRPGKALQELTVLSNFAEVFLAKEGHCGPVGINYLEKAQLPNLPSLYGAMLAGVDYVLMGAGIPREIPGALDALSRHTSAALKLHVADAAPQDAFHVRFVPRDIVPQDMPPLRRPHFFAIVASVTLALSLAKKANGQVDGFVIEGPTAGGHNAPPRGAMKLTPSGEPEYGPKDEVDLERIRQIGRPFWLAGGYGRPEGLRRAQASGGAGIQVGTAFLLCEESGLSEPLKRDMIRRVRRSEIEVFTDPTASPTGFPFKIVPLENTLARDAVFSRRPKVCDLGYLQESFKKADGSVGRRCPAEPAQHYEAKGGQPSQTEGRKCLCNGLLANIGLAQVRRNAYAEKPLVTAGEDIGLAKRFLADGKDSYAAAEVVDYLVGETL